MTNAELATGPRPLDPASALALLRRNAGFRDPAPWVDYAIQHNFAAVDGTVIPACPDCGAPPSNVLGQYIYYSTLLRLIDCTGCGLIWSDVHIDPAVIAGHFERAYKSREYFLAARAPVFDQLARLACNAAPQEGRVIDIGGAQGDLMHLITTRRPDLTGVVQDLSEEALRFAREQFGLATILGDLAALEREGRPFDVLVLSDVLYYEPRVGDFWRVIPRVTAPGGSVVIRVPNKLPLIRLFQQLRGFRAWPNPGQSEVRYFNPEHIYILRASYLARRLRAVGFTGVSVHPSPPLVESSSRVRHLAARALYLVARLVAFVTRGTVILTPSLVVTAHRTDP